MEVDYEEQIHSNSKLSAVTATTTTTSMVSPPSTTTNLATKGHAAQRSTYHNSGDNSESVCSDNEDDAMVGELEDKNNNVKVLSAEALMGMHRKGSSGEGKAGDQAEEAANRNR